MYHFWPNVEPKRTWTDSSVVMRNSKEALLRRKNDQIIFDSTTMRLAAMEIPATEDILAGLAGSMLHRPRVKYVKAKPRACIDGL